MYKKDLIYISIIIITIVGFSLYTKEIRTKQLNYCYQMFKTFLEVTDEDQF